MGVYIKNMELPKHGKVTIQIGSNGSVYFVDKCTIFREKYEINCPAIAIKTPHGKLIDVDVILAQLREMSLDDLSLAEDLIEHGIDDVLDDAPTIIEAEE